MPEPANNMVQAAPGVFLPEAALSFTFSRSGGPGGQNVNKVNTKATLTVPMEALRMALPVYAQRRLGQVASHYLVAEGLQISAAESRSQIANRRACMQKLREVLVEAMRRPKVRKKTKPSARAVQRRLDAKKHRSKIKQSRRSSGRD